MVSAQNSLYSQTMSGFIILFLSAQLVTQVCHGCLNQNSVCHNLYAPECCPQLYSKDGSLVPINGTFCNMRDAPNLGSPFNVGCCQRCWSAGEGCTRDLICCPGYGKVSDPSCPMGQYMCNKTSDFEVKHPKCFTENQYCGKAFKCCKGTLCNTTVGLKNGFGICQKDPDFKGKPPPPTKAYDLPKAPLDPKCYNYYAVEKPTTTTKPQQKKASKCVSEGDSCDSSTECCGGLECPDEWWLKSFFRYIFNWFGFWYKTCSSKQAKTSFRSWLMSFFTSWFQFSASIPG